MSHLHLERNQMRKTALVPSLAMSLFAIAALCTASSAARADEGEGSDANYSGLAGPTAQTLDLQLNNSAPLMQRDGDYGPEEPPPPPPGWRPRRRTARSNRESRTGPIFSFGLGGAQQYVSGDGHSGAFDTDLRLGYGFSDRFQLLFDLGGSEPPQDQYTSISMWHFRVHGQTVLIGDRKGNGLNLNLGIGFGGVSTYGYDNVHNASDVGVSVGGGISYEARILPHFALAPELFATYQQVPNYNNRDSDVGWALGMRLNFVFYSPF
jgi:hypothetical protein